MMKKLGHHLICEATECDPILLNDLNFLVTTLVTACKLGNAEVKSHQSHQFEPQGVTVLVLLSESHCSIHTWPEEKYAMLDVCTCGEHVNARTIFEYISKELRCKTSIKEFERGIE